MFNLLSNLLFLKKMKLNFILGRKRIKMQIIYDSFLGIISMNMILCINEKEVYSFFIILLFFKKLINTLKCPLY